MSASPPEVPNDHEKDPETNSRSAKKVRMKRRRSSSTSSSSNSYSSSSDEARKRKDIKRHTGQSDRKEENEVLLLKVNLRGVLCQQTVQNC